MRAKRVQHRARVTDEADDRAFVDRVAGMEAAMGVPHDLVVVGFIVAIAIVARGAWRAITRGGRDG